MVKIEVEVDTLAELEEALGLGVDAVLLESVDGRTHLAQAKEAFALHKPMFIDKPLASTLEDAREIARLAAEAGVKLARMTIRDIMRDVLVVPETKPLTDLLVEFRRRKIGAADDVAREAPPEVPEVRELPSPLARERRSSMRSRRSK